MSTMGGGGAEAEDLEAQEVKVVATMAAARARRAYFIGCREYLQGLSMLSLRPKRQTPDGGLL